MFGHYVGQLLDMFRFQMCGHVLDIMSEVFSTL